MTSNKDLEKRIERIRIRLHNEIMERIDEDWIYFRDVIIVASLLVMLLGFIVFLVFINQPNYTSASLCELGLMEWEEECLIEAYPDSPGLYSCPAAACGWSEEFFKWVDCFTLENQRIYEFKKSCPSDLKIMVVKK